ncbi:MAG: hypothetical protein H6577_05620 [Lewinellaceae bacterium]|nr:hypothetical protein [Lewinellaceae bacterium]
MLAKDYLLLGKEVEVAGADLSWFNIGTVTLSPEAGLFLNLKALGQRGKTNINNKRVFLRNECKSRKII